MAAGGNQWRAFSKTGSSIGWPGDVKQIDPRIACVYLLRNIFSVQKIRRRKGLMKRIQLLCSEIQLFT